MRKADGTEALARARRLRRDMTPQEALLWSRLRGRRLEGFKFKRQEWVRPYIADFYCWQAKLIVETDGSQHSHQVGYDAARDAYFRSQGHAVLRFWNNEVERDLEAVLTAIRAVLLGRVPSPSRPAAQAGPLPLPEGERGEERRAPSPVQGEGRGPRRRRGEGEGMQ
jgi:very-short-patch-repair endonuclease